MNSMSINRNVWVLTLSLYLGVIGFSTLSAQAADAPKAPERGTAEKKTGEKTTPQPMLAPVHSMDSPNRIPGQYIVAFKPGTSRETVKAAQNTVRKLGGTIGHTYTSAPIGFSVNDLPENALSSLRAIPGVAYIEASKKYSFDTIWVQAGPPTGLDRITKNRLPLLDNSYEYDGKGIGVHVHVIDSGIWVAHSDFGGRAISSFSVVANLDDCIGHGTHVAGTIGGATFGVAKEVILHSVRVGDATCAPTGPNIVAGIHWVRDWKISNPTVPAVANMSLGGPVSLSIDAAVNDAIAYGVTFVVSAGNSNADACNSSPAHVTNAITVGAVDPANDRRASPPAQTWGSNFGPCLDLFAPGVQIVSAMPDGLAALPGCAIVLNTPGSRTQSCSGTSMAAPHVAGVAARYLASFQTKTPAEVWDRINLIANVFPTTASWPGIINPGAGSPNKLLIWLALDDAADDGDPHLTTVGGIHYDFQSAGEFVALRDGNGLHIQTRQTPVTTQPPIADPYTGLATCVSLNTAVAARVGTRRVTYQPNLSGAANDSGLQLRIDGVPTTLGPQGINLGPGARVVKASAGTGIEIDFPDGTNLTATSNFWGPPHNKWYLNMRIFHTPASEGIMGALASGSWLPALPNGTSLGPKPAALHQRYVDLYDKFADAWRVTNATSLFDYAPGTSTATYTLKNWPPEKPPCVVPNSPPAKALDQKTAENLCREVVNKNSKANCVFDVRFTGEPGFAKAYLTSQRIEAGATRTTVNGNKDSSLLGEPVTFTAMVALRAAGRKGIPTGSVQFTLDGSKAGEPLKLDAKGQATWKTARIDLGNHRVAASYIPTKGSVFLVSSSLDESHTVIKEVGK